MQERVSRWTRFTDRLNVVVWTLPAPRRLKALLSRIVYQNPAMPIATVLIAMAALEASGVEVALMGGWGADALIGEQLRPHHDLDLIVNSNHLDKALAALYAIGFVEWFRDVSPTPFGELEVESAVVVRDPAMRVVDLHSMRFARPGPAMTEGTIGGRRVPCMSAELQIQANAKSRARSRRVRRRYRGNLEAATLALQAESTLPHASGRES
jgi:lincosamide nucleotidyltransferase A/C/D/E